MAHVAQVARHGEVPDAFHGEQRTVREARGLPRRRSRRRIEDHGAVALFAHDVGVVVGYMDEHLVVRRVRALGERCLLYTSIPASIGVHVLVLSQKT